MTQGVNYYLIDALTRHQIFIQRFAGGVYKEIEPVVDSLRKSLVSKLSTSNTDIQTIRARVLLGDINDIFVLKQPVFTKILEEQLEKLTEYEVNFQARLLDKVVFVETVRPSIEQVFSSVTTKKMSLISGNKKESMTINELVQRFFGGKSQQIQNTLSAGVVEGLPTKDIVKKISDGINKKIQREAESLVRTATNHCASVARSESMRANADILEGDRYVATLDSRTTLTCAGFDGKVFPLDSGPFPPLHYNCRSTRIPIIKKGFQIPGFDGERPQKGDDGPGVTSGKTTYNSFLKRQSSEFQDEVLGPERAKMFRQGMNVDRFTDPQGRVYRLEELKSMDERFNYSQTTS